MNELAVRFLTENGWSVLSERKARRPGIETVVERAGRRAVIAPRGEGSSLPTTSRHGSAFTRSQVYNHVANSVTRMLRRVATGPTVAALAVPDNQHYREAIESMLGPLGQVGIGTLWVSADGTVTADVPWEV